MDDEDREADLPDNIEYALDRVGPIIKNPEDFMRIFVDKWGGLDERAFNNALIHGVSEERMFAMFALYRTRSEEIRLRLVVQLESPVEVERWAAAICLGQWGDTRAAPVLRRMLSDHLPAHVEGYLERAQWIYQDWRGYAPPLLADLADVDAVPDMRQTLETLIALLDQESPSQTLVENSGWLPGKSNLSDYEDDIVYALGRLRSFGVLTNLRVIDELREKWMAQLIMGSLHGAIRSEELQPRLHNPLVLAALERHLQHVFGIKQVEAARVATTYLQEMRGWLVVHLSIAERSVR